MARQYTQPHKFSPRSFGMLRRPRSLASANEFVLIPDSLGQPFRASDRSQEAAVQPVDFTTGTVLRCTLRKLRARAVPFPDPDERRATWPRINACWQYNITLSVLFRPHSFRWPYVASSASICTYCVRNSLIDAWYARTRFMTAFQILHFRENVHLLIARK